MRVLAISGSLGSGSSNTAALEAVARLAPAGVQVDIDADLGALPPFNPDLETSPPPIVRTLETVGRADALLIATPDYAHGLPGSLKNLLDWLVGSLEFPGKAIGLIDTSPRAHHAQDQLVEVLTTMSARLLPGAAATLPRLGRALDAGSIAADSQLSSVLRGVLAGLTALRGPEDRNAPGQSGGH